MVGHDHVNGVARAFSSAGFTLIESLVALALLSIAFFGIAYGVILTQTLSGSNHDRAIAVASLDMVGDRLEDATYTACATPSQIKAKVGTPPASDGRVMAVTIHSVAYWQVDQTYGATCPSTDRGTELVQVSVTVDSSTVRGSVVLRNPMKRP